MRAMAIWWVLAACAAFAAVEPKSAPPTPARPGFVPATETEISGEAVLVNPAAGRLSVREDNGDRMSFRVSPEVRNLDQIKAGSRVSVRCLQAVALDIAAAPGELGPGSDRVRLAPSDRGPEEATVAPSQAAGTVESIDHARRELKVRTTEGDELALEAPPGTPGFDELEADSAVVVRYTEPIALAVSSAQP